MHFVYTCVSFVNSKLEDVAIRPTSLWLEGDGLTLSWSRIWDEVVNLNMVQSLH